MSHFCSSFTKTEKQQHKFSENKCPIVVPVDYVSSISLISFVSFVSQPRLVIALFFGAAATVSVGTCQKRAEKVPNRARIELLLQRDINKGKRFPSNTTNIISFQSTSCLIFATLEVSQTSNLLALEDTSFNDKNPILLLGNIFKTINKRV